MKKLFFVGMISSAVVANALAQGTIIFENAVSTGNIYAGAADSAHYAQPGTYTVALLWANSTVAVPQAQLTQLALYHPSTAGGDGPGFFFDPSVITTPSGSGVMIFEVQAWQGNYTSYSAAISAGVLAGQTAEFLNNTGNPNPPPTPPINLTGWDGNLLMPSPEPGTLALAGLGAAGLWFFRRAKQQQR